MNLPALFEPLLLIHFDFVSENFGNDYLNDYKLDTRILRDDEQNIKGFALIMKSRLSYEGKDFLSYIAQQDIIVPEINRMKIGHLKYFIHRAQSMYTDLFYEKIYPTSPGDMPLQVFVHQEDLDSLYDEISSKL